MIGTILVVDDVSSLRLSLKRILESKGYKVICTSCVKESLNLSSKLSIDLSIVDLNLPDGRGTELIQHLKSKYPHSSSILITGEQSIHVTITKAMKEGVFHFLPKPFEVDTVLNLVKKSLDEVHIRQQNHNLKSNLKKQFSFDKIIGQSEVVLEMTELMHKVAKSSSSVLITGDSGTGKELVARSIHCARDASQPFISVNCGAIPKELLESEFFGHKKGSFTGAFNNRKGCFEMAERGTLFLDEIGCMDISLQVKLLRVLQEKEFSPVGTSETIPVKAHIIAATNINLEEAVAKNKFREDLYYRLNIIPIYIKPLKDRKEDIPLLIKHFTEIFNAKADKKIEGISQESLSYLLHYPWPGNIRELENLIERLSVLKNGGQIEVKDLPERYLNSQKNSSLATIEIPNEGLNFNNVVDSYENALILKALNKTKWNRRQAAILLGLNRTTLVEKMKKKGLKSPL